MPKRNVAKLTAEQVMELRAMYAANVPVRRLSRLFGITQANVRACATGLTYKDVPGACTPRPWPRPLSAVISEALRVA